MTQPYYTATAGPADPNAGTRAKLYAGLASLTPMLGALSAFNVITTDQAAGVSTWVSATLGLLGLFGFGLAASKTNTQINNGTFAPPAAATPVLDAFQSINAIKTHVDATVSDAQSKVAEGIAAIQGAAAMIPGGALVSSAVLSGPVGDLIQAMTDRQDH